jgi:hypothetical protein
MLKCLVYRAGNINTFYVIDNGMQARAKELSVGYTHYHMLVQFVVVMTYQNHILAQFAVVMTSKPHTCPICCGYDVS